MAKTTLLVEVPFDWDEFDKTIGKPQAVIDQHDAAFLRDVTKAARSALAQHAMRRALDGMRDEMAALQTVRIKRA